MKDTKILDSIIDMLKNELDYGIKYEEAEDICINKLMYKVHLRNHGLHLAKQQYK